MRKSEAETAKTRQHIIRTAAAEFRRDGIGETGLATQRSRIAFCMKRDDISRPCK